MSKPRPNLATRMNRELEITETGTDSPDRAGEPRQEPQPKVYVPPSRRDMKRVQGYFSPRVKRQLKVLAAQKDKTEEELVGEALNMLFRTHGLPTIAFEGKDSRS